MKIPEIKNCCKIDFIEIEHLKNEVYNLQDNTELNCRSEIFKALADPTRLQILSILKFRDLYACEVMVVLDKPQSTISHHLNILKKAGFIKGHKKGIWTLYSLINPTIMEIIENNFCKMDSLEK